MGSNIIMNKKRTNTDMIKQHILKWVDENYIVYNDSVTIKDMKGNIIGHLIKNFFSNDEFERLNKFVLTYPKNKNTIQFIVEPSYEDIKDICDKIFEATSTIETYTSYKYLKIFNNYTVDIHKDADKTCISNLFVVKSQDVKGYTVLPEYGIAFHVDNEDLLIFDISLYHYAVTNKMLNSNNQYRYAMYIQMNK